MVMTCEVPSTLLGVADGEVGYTGPGRGDVVGKGGAASIEAKAAALARRRVGADVVVVEASLGAGDAVAFETIACSAGRCRLGVKAQGHGGEEDE